MAMSGRDARVWLGWQATAWIHPKDVVVMLSKQPEHLHAVCAGMLPGSTRAQIM